MAFNAFHTVNFLSELFSVSTTGAARTLILHLTDAVMSAYERDINVPNAQMNRTLSNNDMGGIYEYREVGCPDEFALLWDTVVSREGR